jgi:hypothetical protein
MFKNGDQNWLRHFQEGKLGLRQVRDEVEYRCKSDKVKKCQALGSDTRDSCSAATVFLCNTSDLCDRRGRICRHWLRCVLMEQPSPCKTKDFG